MFEKIYIELSDICGLKCNFCTNDKSKRKIMDIDKFEFLTSKIKNKAKIFTFHVLGDPFLLSNLKQYLKIAEQNYMKIELTTSGFYFGDKDFLFEFENIHQINISLIALLVQNKINFNDYFKNIDIFLKKHLAIKHNSFINFRLWNFDEKFNYPLENEFLYDFFEQYFNTKFDKKLQRNRLARHIILDQKKQFKWPNLNNKFISDIGTCYALEKQVAILSDGTLVPCCLDSNGCINLGNVFEKDFNELINNEKFLKIKNDFKNNKLTQALCQRCEFVKKNEII